MIRTLCALGHLDDWWSMKFFFPVLCLSCDALAPRCETANLQSDLIDNRRVEVPSARFAPSLHSHISRKLLVLAVIG